MKKQWIVCAATLMKDGAIVTGIRHYSPEMRAIMKKAYGEGYHLLVAQQGFVDNFGKFLSREDAWIIAEKNGQIQYQVSSPSELYSENLY